MKKTYISPSNKVVALTTEHIIADSLKMDNTPVNPSDAYSKDDELDYFGW
ncbi:MAG: hypothetical protein Q4F34_03820 [Prevotellaceae bacterium]|nr:hypothetical protein [Prevotellaceae bacterium]